MNFVLIKFMKYQVRNLSLGIYFLIKIIKVKLKKIFFVQEDQNQINQVDNDENNEINIHYALINEK